MSLGEDMGNGVRGFYRHVAHPHIKARKESGPTKVADNVPQHSAYARFNSRIGLKITLTVGTMTCAWAFTAIALVSLPSALGSKNLIVIVSWVAQTLIQLVLLSIILFGQGLQSQAADARSEATWKDAEAILESASQIAEHLTVQDAHLITQDEKLAAIVDQVAAIVARLTTPPAGGATARHGNT
jgi:hypothetical protein